MLVIIPATGTKKAAANTFSGPQHAQFLAAAALATPIPKLHGVPKAIVTGHANVGGSSLLNVVLGRGHLLRTGEKPVRIFPRNPSLGKGPGKTALADAPGYGGRGRSEWGEPFGHYIDDRKERIFTLFNSGHDLNEIDAIMIQSLDERVQASTGLKFTLQAIITKAGMIPEWRLASSITQVRKDIAGTTPTCLDPIITSTARCPYIDTDAVRNATTQVCQR
ncbi:P-loop containing nucleoside triphosphate hydrolase protein [Thelephora ganbajun]|uniref:P-loop containing nucleoside triphosphate hydrolase protein n=1 Tax=Thelephora ganbajun TaxID=370292 RepID=A0ACB6Z5U2_THEGA|nr:P-loop containing nucleoside triphosphate hydrolase protein [Thelephora ganbajun]